MFCPTCENHKLTEINKDGITLYKCSYCQGIALKHNDLEKIINLTQKVLKSKQKKSILGFDRMKYSKQKEPLAKCPSCKYNLYTIKSKKIELDYCLNCKTFWFDEGELSFFIESYKKGKVMFLESLESTNESTMNLIFSLLE